ncbi:hypothetical protein MCEMKE138_00236 [Candidatus Pelagibacterales bacterium]|jgi:hypothetical protein
MKNLALAFCSLRPINYKKKINDFREIEYLNCLKQLLRIIPKNFDIIICENTIDKIDDINNDELKILLKNNNTLFLGSVFNNIKNIGMGELTMLYHSLKKCSLKKYKFISYISARKIYTCPYVFEKTNSLKKDTLISNPNFLYLTGKYFLNPKKELFNDMFFSMKKKFMIKYANFAMTIVKKNPKFLRYNLIKKKPAGSEQILFEFIKKEKLSYEYLDWLGIIRNQVIDSKDYFNIKNFHIC